MSKQSESGDRPAGERDFTPLPVIGGDAGRIASDAQRIVSDAEVASRAARIADGWERRFVADGPRAEEAIGLYRELGFEVLADPVAPEDLDGGCGECHVPDQPRFRVIYTRRPPGWPAG